MHDGGHLVVERRQDVRCALHQRGEQPTFVEVFGHFNADVPAPDHHRPPGLGGRQVAHDAVQVRDVAQRKHPGRVNARQLGVHRFAAGRQQQLVVAFVGFLAGLQVAQAHGFGPAVDGHGLGQVAHVHVVAGLEQRFGRDQQVVPLGNHAADVVRQAAVGKADVGPAFNQHNLRRLVVAPQTGRCRGTARHAANDENFHVFYPRGLWLPMGGFCGRTAALARV